MCSTYYVRNLFFLFFAVCFGVVSGSGLQAIVAGLTITSAPSPKATHCLASNALFRRDNTCSFGTCGSTCLAQGAFCCNPAGSLAPEPQWICDNGACITSVRGTMGIVDCYDPDNPTGTTQSCIDNVPTTTCASTDRCYTCDTNQPFCHWQTYIASGSPTLRWFSCVETSTTDELFYASTVTSLTAPTATAQPTLTDTALSRSAIAGISAGGAAFLVLASVGIGWCVVNFRRRRRIIERRRTAKQRKIVHELPVRRGYTYPNRKGSSGGESTQRDWGLGLQAEEPWKWQAPSEAASVNLVELPASTK